MYGVHVFLCSCNMFGTKKKKKKLNVLEKLCNTVSTIGMNGLAVGIVWQSMYFLDQRISNLPSGYSWWFRSRQTDRHRHRHARTVGNPRSGDGWQNLCQTIINLPWVAEPGGVPCTVLFFSLPAELQFFSAPKIYPVNNSVMLIS